MTDYTAMDGPELHEACGADGSKWAAAYVQHVKKVEGVVVDEGLALTWFCNAMMAMHDHMRPDLAPVRLPDGSAFCVAGVGNK
jgi:hypothetical protein